MILLLTISLMMVLATCSDDNASGDDDDDNGEITISGALTVPAAWEGVWNLTFAFSDCEGGHTYAEQIILDTMQTGDSLSLYLPVFEECSGIVKGDSLIISGTTGWWEGVCSVTVTCDVSAENNNGVISGSGEWTLELHGVCATDNYVAGCEAIEVTGLVSDL